MRKRRVSILLALCMALALFSPAFAADASGSCGNGVTWSYSGGVLTIQGTGPMNDYGYGAYHDAAPPWRDYRGEIHTVMIGDGVTSIGNEAFFDCDRLACVVIPDSVINIGEAAFMSCDDLTDVTIPGSVTTIGNAAFSWCAGLTDVTIPDSVTAIGDLAFSWCTGLTDVIIPDSVTAIGESAFMGCGSLTYVTIPGSVTAISRGTFDLCTGLIGAAISDGVTAIGDLAFSWCGGLTGVTVPGSVTAIGKNAFDHCDSLKDIYYGGSERQWKQIRTDRTGNDPLTKAAIHDGSAVPAESILPAGPMPAESVPAEPETAAGPVIPDFTDVDAGAWYAEGVLWAAGKGYVEGDGSGRFLPGKTCANVEIVTFLWKAEERPAAAAAAPVTVAGWARDAVNWAYEKGVIDETFRPDDGCTRANMAYYIWKVFGSQSPQTGAGFPDVDPDAYYAEAAAWAVEERIVTGYNGLYSPDVTCDRGMIATLLCHAYVPVPQPRE